MIKISKEGICEICGKGGIVTEHHKIKRGKQPALIKCKKNLIDLCEVCHFQIHHGKNGHALDQKIKLTFQNFLEFVFDKEYFTIEDIQATLEITYKASYSLCKSLKRYKGIFYKREDIIRSAMGDRIIEESEVTNE